MKVYIDLDGVLTDGKVWYDHKGRAIKSFNSRDNRAIKELAAHGYEVIIITASTWPGAISYAKKVGAQLSISRQKESMPPDSEPYIAIGDDIWDVKLLEGAERAFCPNNASPLVRIIKGITILSKNGGEGVIAELVEELIKVDEIY